MFSGDAAGRTEEGMMGEMKHAHWTADRYRREMGLSKGVVVPTSSKVRKSIAAMNKNEQAYAHYLAHEKLAGHVVNWWAHPFRLKLPGWKNSYEPDFLVQVNQDDLEIVELKALWRNGKVGWKDDARNKFKTAAGIYTCFAWVVKWRDEHACWQEERFF